MCRWLAYIGPPVFVSDVLVHTDHSLIDQSLASREGDRTTNGDGFGIGWYNARPAPGVFKDVYPAWNDKNLLSIADQTRSPLFFAHVRAATGTPVQRSNSHPFAHGRWLFQHNGVIPEYPKLKRRLLGFVDDTLFPSIAGSTDSELMFFIALSMGLREDPPGALARMIGTVERERRDARVDGVVHFSAAAADGERLWTVRYASPGDTPEHAPRTLYRSSSVDTVEEVLADRAEAPESGTIITSEPLEVGAGLWEAVPPSTMLIVDRRGGVEAMPFEPAA